ncbi:MAG: hypothetical protein WDW36_010070 [Sanguina aurantia]
MALNFKAVTKNESWADDEVVEPEPALVAFKAGGKGNTADDFPSLGEAVKAPQLKKKKQFGAKVDLATFNKTPAPASAGSGPMRVGPSRATEKDILMSLPTGSTGRVDGAEGAAPGLGGGFTTYGGQAREGGYRRKDDMDEMRAPRESELMGPSRAEEVDDWATTRKFVAGEASGGRGGGFGGGGGGSSRDFGDRPPRPEGSSDAVDDWGKERKFEASAARPSGGGGSGGGGSFGDRPERRGYEPRPVSKADDQDEWGSSRTFAASAAPAEREQRRGFNFSDNPAAARPADAEDRWARRAAAAAADDSAAAPAPSTSQPADRPRLQLAARTKPIENPLPPLAPSSLSAGGGSETAAAAAPAPTRPVEAPKPRSNPFGAARPREEVLKEKGVDVMAEAAAAEKPRKHEPAAPAAPSRKESEEEKALRAQVEELAAKLAGLQTESEQPAADADEGEDEAFAQVAQDLREARLTKEVKAAEESLSLAERKLQSLVQTLEAEHAAAVASAAEAKVLAAQAKAAAAEARAAAAEAKAESAAAAAAAAAAVAAAAVGAAADGAAAVVEEEGSKDGEAAPAPAPSKPRW